MGEVRDFRQETIDFIKENLVDTEPNNDAFFDFFENIFSFNKSLDSDLGNFDKYMERICEINDITSAELDKIITEVHAVENSYEAKFNGHFSDITCCRTLLDTLCTEISEGSFETSFDKEVIYKLWDDIKALEELRRSLEGLSDEELLALDTSAFSDEELSVYMKIAVDRLNAADEDYQASLLALIEQTGQTYENEDLYVGILLSLIMGGMISPEKAAEYGQIVAEFIAAHAGASLKMFEFKIVCGNITMTYSVSISFKTTDPDAIVTFRESLFEDLRNIKFSLGETGYIKIDQDDFLTAGIKGGGLTVEGDLTRAMFGIVKMSFSCDVVDNEYYTMSAKVGVEIKMNPPQIPQAVPALIPVAITFSVPWLEQAWQDVGDWWEADGAEIVGGLLIFAGVCIIVGTIIEDIVTLGIGVADDPATIAAGAALIAQGAAAFS